MSFWYYNDVDGKTLAITKQDNGDMMFRILRGNCMEAVVYITKKEIEKGNIL